eukprot:GHVS01083619.1.p1 GENE.GHVS01083619.1~~GHVS01083619.1.p1  ORF type:complete len:116 (-),score=16.72 GHVS01083619.1:94-441(-)
MPKSSSARNHLYETTFVCSSFSPNYFILCCLFVYSHGFHEPNSSVGHLEQSLWPLTDNRFDTTTMPPLDIVLFVVVETADAPFLLNGLNTTVFSPKQPYVLDIMLFLQKTDGKTK